jgi:hypothetical protein
LKCRRIPETTLGIDLACGGTCSSTCTNVDHGQHGLEASRENGSRDDLKARKSRHYGGFLSGSDGTRTRDLRRDRPAL